MAVMVSGDRKKAWKECLQPAVGGDAKCLVSWNDPISPLNGLAINVQVISLPSPRQPKANFLQIPDARYCSLPKAILADVDRVAHVEEHGERFLLICEVLRTHFQMLFGARVADYVVSTRDGVQRIFSVSDSGIHCSHTFVGPRKDPRGLAPAVLCQTRACFVDALHC